MEIIQGVYKITNIHNGNKVYIGRSTDIYRRWKEHRRKLIKGEHHCQELQFDIDVATMDEVCCIDDILRFEIIENIPDKDFKFRELEEIHNIPKDQIYNLPDLKDEILYRIGTWCRDQNIDFEIDFAHPDCKNTKPLNWNMRINTGDMVILLILRMETDDPEMTIKYRNMDEIRDNWINTMPDNWNWILKIYNDVWDDPVDIANEIIVEINQAILSNRSLDIVQNMDFITM